MYCLDSRDAKSRRAWAKISLSIRDFPDAGQRQSSSNDLSPRLHSMLFESIIGQSEIMGSYSNQDGLSTLDITVEFTYVPCFSSLAGAVLTGFLTEED